MTTLLVVLDHFASGRRAVRVQAKGHCARAFATYVNAGRIGTPRMRRLYIRVATVERDSTTRQVAEGSCDALSPTCRDFDHARGPLVEMNDPPYSRDVRLMKHANVGQIQFHSETRTQSPRPSTSRHSNRPRHVLFVPAFGTHQVGAPTN